MALTGGMLSLFILGMPFSISAAIGFVALFGIAAMNGIMVLSLLQPPDRGGHRARAGAARDLRAADAAGADDLRRRLRRPAARRLLDRDRQPGAAAAGDGVVGGTLLAPFLFLTVLPARSACSRAASARSAVPTGDRRGGAVMRPPRSPRRSAFGAALGRLHDGARLPAARPAQDRQPILPDQPTELRRRRHPRRRGAAHRRRPRYPRPVVAACSSRRRSTA